MAIASYQCQSLYQDKNSDTTIVLELPSSTSDRYCTSNNIEQILLLNGTLSLMLGYNISYIDARRKHMIIIFNNPQLTLPVIPACMVQYLAIIYH